MIELTPPTKDWSFDVLRSRFEQEHYRHTTNKKPAEQNCACADQWAHKERTLLNDMTSLHRQILELQEKMDTRKSDQAAEMPGTRQVDETGKVLGDKVRYVERQLRAAIRREAEQIEKNTQQDESLALCRDALKGFMDAIEPHLQAVFDDNGLSRDAAVAAVRERGLIEASVTLSPSDAFLDPSKGHGGLLTSSLRQTEDERAKWQWHRSQLYNLGVSVELYIRHFRDILSHELDENDEGFTMHGALPVDDAGQPDR